MRVRALVVLTPVLTAATLAAAVGVGPVSLAFGQLGASATKQVAPAVGLLPAPAAAAIRVAANAAPRALAVIRHRAAAPAPAAPVRHVPAAATPAATPTAIRAAHRAQAPATATPAALQLRTQPAATPTTPAAPPTTQSSGGDDYPYRSASGNPSDPWGFTERQCVSFVAWRLSEYGRALNNARDSWGSATTWDDTARRLGHSISSRPSVGSVAQWNAGESSPYYASGSATANGSFVAGGYGHVAWVRAVYADGSALVEQYNVGGDRSYSLMRVKAPRYLSL